jgi:hypothetical protein
MGVSGPNPLDLPNDCGIVATEAASRLSATGSWTRIVQIRLVRDGKTTGHSIVVWQPPTARHIWAYDEFLLDGSFDTGVVLRDPQKDLPAVMKSIAEVSHRELLAAWYCK